MQASRHILNKLQVDNYYRLKLESLKRIKKFALEGRQAIEMLDFALLDRIMKKVESTQTNIESIEAELQLQKESIVLSKQEETELVNLQDEVESIVNENLRLLKIKRNEVLMELKSLRAKRNASRVYGGALESKVSVDKSR